MAYSPSQKWEDGKLIERAQDSRGVEEENTAVAVTGSPTKPAQPNSTFSSRRDARLGETKSKAKAVKAGDVEDKAVTGSRTSTKRR